MPPRLILETHWDFLLSRSRGEREEIVRRLVEGDDAQTLLSLGTGGKLVKNILDQRTDLGVTGLSLRARIPGMMKVRWTRIRKQCFCASSGLCLSLSPPPPPSSCEK